MKIDPQKFYNLSELVALGQEGYFPVKSRPTLYRLIRENKLKATNVTVRSKNQFFILGNDILKFVNAPAKVYPYKQRNNVSVVREDREHRWTPPEEKKLEAGLDNGPEQHHQAMPAVSSESYRE